MVAPLHIAAGIIRSASNEVFITRRLAGKPLADKWEFPGGKIHPGESPSRALARELWEEIDIRIACWSLFDVQSCLLQDRSGWITLWFYLVTRWQGQPWGKEGQPGRWLPVWQLMDVDFPGTNTPAIVRLQCESPV